ncbi:hypothetical protein B4082_0697 [Bacillus cereus]|uniref:Uncharacterized protein n=1 Tax=Bacillus cereus TaxID=1396 RepID=A0A164HJL4_BACCE|nr:hypothetical protein B4082_0697 [Bacillus cereus]
MDPFNPVQLFSFFTIKSNLENKTPLFTLVTVGFYFIYSSSGTTPL